MRKALKAITDQVTPLINPPGRSNGRKEVAAAEHQDCQGSRRRILSLRREVVERGKELRVAQRLACHPIQQRRQFRRLILLMQTRCRYLIQTMLILWKMVNSRAAEARQRDISIHQQIKEFRIPAEDLLQEIKAARKTFQTTVDNLTKDFKAVTETVDKISKSTHRAVAKKMSSADSFELWFSYDLNNI